MVPEILLKVCELARDVSMSFEELCHLWRGPLKTEKKDDKNLYWSPGTKKVLSP